MEAQDKAERTAWLSLIGNFFMAGIKATVGILGNSYALIADAIESTGDVFSSALVLIGFRYARRPPDENHPYGHGKVEPLITFVVVGFLVGSATLIIIESIHNIQRPHKAPKAFTLYFIAGVVLAKELMFRYVAKTSKEINSTSLKADAWHHRSDAITSLFAFVGISIGVFFGDKYAAADDWAALIASFIIFYNAYLIFRPALGEIMDEHRYDELIDKIRKTAMEVEGILDTEKCWVRKSGMRYWVDIHIHIDGKMSVYDGHELSHRLKAHILETIPEVADVLIHMEPAGEHSEYSGNAEK